MIEVVRPFQMSKSHLHFFLYQLFYLFLIVCSETAVAPHSSTLAWKIPWTEEPGRLQSMGSLIRQTWLIDFTFTFHFHALEKEMATCSSILAWRIPGTGEPGGPPSTGSHRVGHDWGDLAAAALSVFAYCVFVMQKSFLNFLFSCNQICQSLLFLHVEP